MKSIRRGRERVRDRERPGPSENQAAWYVAFQYNNDLSVSNSRNGPINVRKLGINGPM